MVEESGLGHLYGSQTLGSKRRIHTQDLKRFREADTNGLFTKQGDTILERECPLWVNLAEKLENSAENRSKISILEKRLSQILLSESAESDVAFDEVEAGCKLEEYRLAIYREITSVKLVMLQDASVEWTRRLDNIMLE